MADPDSSNDFDNWHPFDASMKQMFQEDLPGFFQALQLNVSGELRVLNTDLSAVYNLSADGLVMAERPGHPNQIFHLEFQSSHDADMPARLAAYNCQVALRYKVEAVSSIVILLRKTAFTRGLRGPHRRSSPALGENLWFKFQVVKLYDLPTTPFLNGPLSMMPLAMFTKIRRSNLVPTLHRISERARRHGTEVQHREILALIYTMLGLRPDAERDLLAQEIQTMIQIRDSQTARDLIEEGLQAGRLEGLQEGRLEGLQAGRQVLLAQGTQRFGEPDQAILKRIQDCQDLGRLRDALMALLDVDSWNDLVGKLDG